MGDLPGLPSNGAPGAPHGQSKTWCSLAEDVVLVCENYIVEKGWLALPGKRGGATSSKDMADMGAPVTSTHLASKSHPDMCFIVFLLVYISTAPAAGHFLCPTEVRRLPC